jgi:hypothetical protein
MGYGSLTDSRGGDLLRDVVCVVITQAFHELPVRPSYVVHEGVEVLSCGHLEKIRSYFAPAVVPPGSGRPSKPKQARRCSKCRRAQQADVIGFGVAADEEGTPIEITDTETKYRVVGKFVGGCHWESNKTFPSPGHAWAWWTRHGASGPSPSVLVRVVPAE